MSELQLVVLWGAFRAIVAVLLLVKGQLLKVRGIMIGSFFLSFIYSSIATYVVLLLYMPALFALGIITNNERLLQPFSILYFAGVLYLLFYIELVHNTAALEGLYTPRKIRNSSLIAFFLSVLGMVFSLIYL